MARAPAPVARETGVLHAARGYISAGELAVFRRGGKPGENRRSLPVLRVVRSGEREDGEILFRVVGGGRGGDRAADSAISGGETFPGAVTPPLVAGFLGRGAERPGAEIAARAHSAVMDYGPGATPAWRGARRPAGRRPRTQRLARSRGRIAEGARSHHQDQWLS